MFRLGGWLGFVVLAGFLLYAISIGNWTYVGLMVVINVLYWIYQARRR
jgi:accessory gene regulator protein AgrB